MNQKILITGPPRCGKSTLISKLIEYYRVKKNYTIYGFLTPEVRKSGNRIGFDIQDIFSKGREKLARIGSYTTSHKLGKYGIFLEGLEKIISNIETIPHHDIDLLIIDEIGKMELFSKKFQDFIPNIFASNLSIIATIGLNFNHPIKTQLLNLPNINLLNLDRLNFQKVYQDIISIPI
ncbi:MAG: nucleoside-triphosphatase [Promethearchaeota archaeon]|jgi:nucleoside-triphosphatase